MFKTNHACLFSEIHKKTTDLLSKDYFNGSQLKVKIKKLQPLNMLLEAKTDEGNPILSKVSCDFEVNENYNVKNISLDSSGLIMGDVDIEKLVKNTTFMIHAWKNVNENGMKKLEVGAKYMEKNCVCQGSFDVATCKYSASLVYAYEQFLAGFRLYGNGLESLSCDSSLSYRVDNKMIVGCSAYDLMSTINLYMYYYIRRDFRVAACCSLKPGSGIVPDYSFGICYKPNRRTVFRAKFSDQGVLSGCVKTEIDKQITLFSCVTANIKDIGMSNKASVGIEIVF